MNFQTQRPNKLNSQSAIPIAFSRKRDSAIILSRAIAHYSHYSRSPSTSTKIPCVGLAAAAAACVFLPQVVCISSVCLCLRPSSCTGRQESFAARMCTCNTVRARRAAATTWYLHTFLQREISITRQRVNNRAFKSIEREKFCASARSCVTDTRSV